MQQAAEYQLPEVLERAKQRLGSPQLHDGKNSRFALDIAQSCFEQLDLKFWKEQDTLAASKKIAAYPEAASEMDDPAAKMAIWAIAGVIAIYFKDFFPDSTEFRAQLGKVLDDDTYPHRESIRKYAEQIPIHGLNYEVDDTRRPATVLDLIDAYDFSKGKPHNGVERRSGITFTISDNSSALKAEAIKASSNAEFKKFTQALAENVYGTHDFKSKLTSPVHSNFGLDKMKQVLSGDDLILFQLFDITLGHSALGIVAKQDKAALAAKASNPEIQRRANEIIIGGAYFKVAANQYRPFALGDVVYKRGKLFRAKAVAEDCYTDFTTAIQESANGIIDAALIPDLTAWPFTDHQCAMINAYKFFLDPKIGFTPEELGQIKEALEKPNEVNRAAREVNISQCCYFEDSGFGVSGLPSQTNLNDLLKYCYEQTHEVSHRKIPLLYKDDAGKAQLLFVKFVKALKSAPAGQIEIPAELDAEQLDDYQQAYLICYKVAFKDHQLSRAERELVAVQSEVLPAPINTLIPGVVIPTPPFFQGPELLKSLTPELLLDIVLKDECQKITPANQLSESQFESYIAAIQVGAEDAILDTLQWNLSKLPLTEEQQAVVQVYQRFWTSAEDRLPISTKIVRAAHTLYEADSTEIPLDITVAGSWLPRTATATGIATAKRATLRDVLGDFLLARGQIKSVVRPLEQANERVAAGQYDRFLQALTNDAVDGIIDRALIPDIEIERLPFTEDQKAAVIAYKLFCGLITEIPVRYKRAVESLFAKIDKTVTFPAQTFTAIKGLHYKTKGASKNHPALLADIVKKAYKSFAFSFEIRKAKGVFHKLITASELAADDKVRQEPEPSAASESALDDSMDQVTAASAIATASASPSPAPAAGFVAPTVDDDAQSQLPAVLANAAALLNSAERCTRQESRFAIGIVNTCYKHLGFGAPIPKQPEKYSSNPVATSEQIATWAIATAIGIYFKDTVADSAELRTAISEIFYNPDNPHHKLVCAYAAQMPIYGIARHNNDGTQQQATVLELITAFDFRVGEPFEGVEPKRGLNFTIIDSSAKLVAADIQSKSAAKFAQFTRALATYKLGTSAFTTNIINQEQGNFSRELMQRELIGDDRILFELFDVTMGHHSRTFIDNKYAQRTLAAAEKPEIRARAKEIIIGGLYVQDTADTYRLYTLADEVDGKAPIVESKSPMIYLTYTPDPVFPIKQKVFTKRNVGITLLIAAIIAGAVGATIALGLPAAKIAVNLATMLPAGILGAIALTALIGFSALAITYSRRASIPAGYRNKASIGLGGLLSTKVNCIKAMAARLGDDAPDVFAQFKEGTTDMTPLFGIYNEHPEWQAEMEQQFPGIERQAAMYAKPV